MYLNSPYITEENRLYDDMQFYEEFEATSIGLFSCFDRHFEKDSLKT